MIASGEKKEEYREYKPFWEKRMVKWASKALNTLSNPKVQVVAFSHGYKKADMFFKVHGVFLSTAYPYRPLFLKWGEPETPHYVICLGKRVELVD